MEQQLSLWVGLQEVQVRALVGVFQQEQENLQDFVVTLELESQSTTSMTTDELNDAVDYQLLNTAISHGFATPAKLLEHVAQRIITYLKGYFPGAAFRLQIQKLSPPIPHASIKASMVKVHGVL